LNWKLRLVLLLALLSLALALTSPFIVNATTKGAKWLYVQALNVINADVTITATPSWGGPDAPENFTLTYVSETEVGITWDIGTNADNTLIRAKYGEYPEDSTDGYEVYFGPGWATSDTGVNFDITLENVYYRAWSTNGIGTSTDYAEANMEGLPVLLLGTIILILGLTGIAYYSRWGILLFFAGISIMRYGFSLRADNLYLSIIIALFGFSTVIYAFMPKGNKSG